VREGAIVAFLKGIGFIALIAILCLILYQIIIDAEKQNQGFALGFLFVFLLMKCSKYIIEEMKK
jgi:hypothetical protein